MPKHPLEQFKQLPSEVLFEHILAKYAKTCLYVCKEWYSILKDYLPYDTRIRAWKAFNYGIDKSNVTLCLRSLPRLNYLEWHDLYDKHIRNTNTPPEIIYGLATHRFALNKKGESGGLIYSIQCSIEYNRLDLFKMLIARSDVDINKVINEQRSFYNRRDFVRILLDHPNIDVNSDKLMEAICYNEDKESIDRVIHNHKFRGGTLKHGLDRLCTTDNLELIKLFLCLIKDDDLTDAFETAIICYKFEVIQLLLDDGRVKPDRNDWWSVRYSNMYYCDDIVEAIAKYCKTNFIFN